MNSARILVSGNLALAPHAVETVTAPKRPRLAVVNGARAVHAVAPARQLWAPDVFAARSAKRSSVFSIARSVIAGMTLVALAGVLAFSFVSARAASERAAAASVQRAEVSVAPGDSLWSLASAHPVEGLDTAKTVELICDWNGLRTGMLTVGTVLSVPVAS